MKRSCWLLLAVALAGVVPSSGCSPGPRVTKVLVALNLDNKPLTFADVRLLPKDDPGLGDGGSGQTAADGKVEILANPKRPIRPGRYVVLVKKLVGKDGSPFRMEDDIAVRPGREGAGVQNLLPPVYGDKDRSPLIVTLTADENAVTLELNSKQR
jgi:hypothetical protein